MIVLELITTLQRNQWWWILCSASINSNQTENFSYHAGDVRKRKIVVQEMQLTIIIIITLWKILWWPINIDIVPLFHNSYIESTIHFSTNKQTTQIKFHQTHNMNVGECAWCKMQYLLESSITFHKWRTGKQFQRAKANADRNIVSNLRIGKEKNPNHSSLRITNMERDDSSEICLPS